MKSNSWCRSAGGWDHTVQRIGWIPSTFPSSKTILHHLSTSRESTPNYTTNKSIFNIKHWRTLSRNIQTQVNCWTHTCFIAARKRHNLLQLWQSLFLYTWKTQNSITHYEREEYFNLVGETYNQSFGTVQKKTEEQICVEHDRMYKIRYTLFIT